MKISVITINLNNMSGLEQTIKSVVNQTYLDIEYIVIDGGSTDGSVLIAEDSKESISYFLSERDTGIYNAMNKGIDRATGDYLLFLNSGDRLLHSGIIEEVVSTGLNEDLVYGDLLFFDKDKDWPWHLPDTLTFEHFYTSTIPHPCTFIKRILFATVGKYDEQLKIVSDWKFFILAIAKHNCTYKHIPMLITAYSFDGISSRPENLKLISTERNQVLQSEFSSFVKDYDTLLSLRELLAHKGNLIRLLFKRMFGLSK